MDIHDMKLNEIIKLEFLESYKKSIDGIWAPIISINSYLYIIDKILNFPLELFQPLKRLFWNLVVEALYEQIIIKMFIVIVDSSDKSINTIRGIKNKLLKNAISDEIKKEIIKKLELIKFDRSIANFEDRIRYLRNKVYAHIDVKFLNNIGNTPSTNIVLNLDELKSIADSLNEFYICICFSEARSPYYIDYAPEKFVSRCYNYSSDIEEILNLLAKESDLLNMPERQPGLWPHFKEKYSTREIKILNQYRKKFNKREV